VLVVLAIVAWTQAAIHLFWPAPTPRMEFAVPTRAAPSHEASGRSEAELAAFMPLFDRFHGKAPEEPPVAPPVDQSTRLPLGAFHVSIPIWDGDVPLSVHLHSKDPAHPVAHTLAVGEERDGLLVEGVIRETGRVLVRLRRGEESVTLEVARGAVTSRAVRDIPAARVAAEDVPRAQGPVRGGLRDVKVVPFFGEDGSPVGARITGVRPGGWAARAGAKAGDVIVALGGAEVRGPEDLGRALRGGNGPTELRVRRDHAAPEPLLSLRVDSVAGS
jgi:hypothetical protein